MKTYIKLMIIPLTLLLSNCTSGQNSAVDSHPGNGSVKANGGDKADDQKDTTKKDSLRVRDNAQ